MRQPIPSEATALRSLVRTRRPDRMRAVAILHALNGSNIAQICRATGHERAVVRRWLDEWERALPIQ